jgi:hypothetical protein
MGDQLCHNAATYTGQRGGTSMRRVGLETTVSVLERPKMLHVLDRAATVFDLLYLNACYLKGCLFVNVTELRNSSFRYEKVALNDSDIRSALKQPTASISSFVNELLA